MSLNNLYLGLVHYPVNNKFGEVVTTSITNLDIHDISRTCMTYGIRKYFIITPLSSQVKLLERLLGFWKTPKAEDYNRDRVEALSLVAHANTIEDTIQQIKLQESNRPIVVTTTAGLMSIQKTFNDVRVIIREKNQPILLLFGTGNGLIKDVHIQSDIVLEPIVGSYNYNHLSVRSAVAIILDRLISER